MRRLPVCGAELADLLEKLMQAEDKDKIPLIEAICERLMSEFMRQNISDCKDCYMVAQGESIHRHIQNKGLRGTDPWQKADFKRFQTL